MSGCHGLFRKMRGLLLGVCIGAVVASAEFNVASQCRLGSTPYAGFTLNTLIDGYAGEEALFAHNLVFNLRTHQTDMRLGAAVRFALPSPAALVRVRVYRDRPGIDYVVRGDTTGDGDADTALGKIEGGGAGWGVLEIDARTVRNVEIRAANGDQPVYFGLSEVELWVRGKGLGQAKVVFPDADSGEVIPFEGMDLSIAGDRLDKSLYLFGPQVYRNPEYWARAIAALGVNSVVIYPHQRGNLSDYYKGAYTVPEDPLLRRYLVRGIRMMAAGRDERQFYVGAWPSRTVPGMKGDQLRRTVEAMHGQGLKVIASPDLLLIPFNLVRHFPRGGQSDWHNLPASPCLSSDNFVFRLGASINRELVELGFDGIVLGGDEFRSEGHRLSNLSPYDPCIQRFAQDTGCAATLAALPLGAEDSLAYRQWKLFEYRGVARLFRKWTEDLRQAKPDAVATNLFVFDFGVYADRMGGNLAFDLLGHTGGMDYLCTDYHRPLTTAKYLAAAHCARKAGYVWKIGPFSPVYHAQARAIDTYGPLFAILGQTGCELAALKLYESRHIFEAGTAKKTEWSDIRAAGRQTVGATFRALRFLQKQGITEARTPRRVALLYSRTSTDWWQLRCGYIESASLASMRRQWGEDWAAVFSERITPERTQQNLDQMAGYIWSQAVADLFTSRGYAYDIYYADRPETLQPLREYDVIVIPFGYSISGAALRQIRDAVDAGTALVIVNRLGEVDEWGRPYAVPGLREFLGRERVTRVEMEIADRGEADLAEAILPHVDRYAKQPRWGFRIVGDPALYGQVFAFFLTNGNRRFVTLLNFSLRQAPVEINLPAPGRRLRQVSLAGVCALPTTTEFTQIRRVLPPGAGVVLIVD